MSSANLIDSRARLTMEDRNVDLQEGIKLRSVRRRLFQDDNSEQNLDPGAEDNFANRLYEETRKSREEAKQRWNFDFEKEVPLEGRYEWKKVTGDEEASFDSTENDNEPSNDEKDEETEEENNTREDEEPTSNEIASED